jgi:type I restriction enzyme, R subunit
VNSIYSQRQEALLKSKLITGLFKSLIDAYVFSGQDPVREDVLKCLGNRPSILLKARDIGERIIGKMKEFVKVFVEGMVA